jgi:hypothetical protein
LFSTKRKALRALRSAVEKEAAEQLMRIDRLLDREQSGDDGEAS